MKKEEKSTIRLINVIAPMIGSRDVVFSLRELITKARSQAVILDFSGVEFVSRSAAHEFLVLKDELKAENIDIEFTNLKDESEAANMLRLVAANRMVPRTRNEPRFEKVSAKALFA
ncbi:MAG: STAS domain-containing protein [bacterium]|nr:STAS domain-containing protein [bacterium]